jgi:hypothetical protein
MSGHATNGADCEVKWDGCWSWGLNIRGRPTVHTSYTSLNVKIGYEGMPSQLDRSTESGV